MAQPLTVAAVRQLCEAAAKDYAVVLAVAGGQTQFVTWGREANHKVQASDLAEYLGNHLCGPDAPVTVLESFHGKEEAARNKARVEVLERALRRLSDALAGHIPTGDPEFPVNGVTHAMLEAHEALARAGS